MKRNSLIVFFLMLLFNIVAQHTFSIVAVDPVTGEVGGAGATCYATVNDIADVHPGLGFIHTQSYVNSQNQAFASSLMEQGYSPQEIMDSMALTFVDADNAPTYRQYAAVDLIDGGRSAAYTGTDCFNYKGQRLGQTYAIAGNILLGPEVLDSMESRFLNTQGSLAERLMAALQGGKLPGADTRCADSLVSSLSAYIIVAKPADIATDYYINLNVENVMPQDPIDVLQSQFDDIIQSRQEFFMPELPDLLLYPNPFNESTMIEFYNENEAEFVLDVYNMMGDRVKRVESIYGDKIILKKDNLPKGIYFIELRSVEQSFMSKVLID